MSLTKHDIPHAKSLSTSPIDDEESEIEGILEPKRKWASPPDSEFTEHWHAADGNLPLPALYPG